MPVAVAVLLVSAFALGGFGTDPPAPAATGPVAMVERDLTPDVARLCQAVVSDLPETVAGKQRRAVTAGAEQNAAYGDPAITLECGTALPTVDETALVYPLSGVCWYPTNDDNRTMWTAVDRTVPVTVAVPGPSDGTAQSVVPFSEAVGANLPLRGAVPTGCSSPVPTAS